ncbi:NAD(P)H-hydrate dehydratase [uncultured Sphaerochaeta sp.]|uniref:NAD(P)H-hydrate dehydratase n=1 Tax=uncultured Sphaerochaeta sp. TaxID=886478 RepID=UPI002AA62849|nr:NAD(P)H-hydrate dehydratase [uncultured Sphaerochaeta sp.]
MKRLVLSSEVSDIDAKAQSLAKIPALCLMESAGLQIYQKWKSQLACSDRLVFLCGGGNNGGDALVVARYAYNDGFHNMLLVYTGAHISPSCEVQRSIAEAYMIPQLDWDVANDSDRHALFENASWIVDGLVGTGLKGPLKKSLQTLVLQANKSPAKRLAIDIPSAVGDAVPVSSVHIHADMTVTMGLEKMAMYHPASRASCGRIILVNPSFPQFLLDQCKATVLLCERVRAALPILAENEFKTSRGHIAIFGGSKQYSGAARLSSRTAFSSRAGLVTLFCDKAVYPVASSESASVMVQVYEGQNLERFDAVLAGPGWGEGREALLETLLASGLPMVLDADGIRAYASIVKQGKLPSHGPMILTPHLGELRTLVWALFPDDAHDLAKDDTPSSFFSVLERTASLLDATLVVKSQLVYVVSPGKQTVVVEGNNPSLGVAGSGDVLSGILVALLAKLRDCTQVALEGTLIHQRAGSLAAAQYGYYDSETLISYVGRATQEAER